MTAKVESHTPTSGASNAQPNEHHVLVGRSLDAWLVGGLGIAAWVFFKLPQWGVLDYEPQISGAVYWVLLAITGTHFGASYHLAYGQGRGPVRRQWVPLLAVPVVLALVAIALCAAALAGASGLANGGVRFLLASVFTLTSWHYIKQVYGVTRLGASLRGVRLDEPEVLVLRYGLYPLWLLQAVHVWAGRTGRSFDGLEAGYNIVPAPFVDGLYLLTWISMPVIALVFVRMAFRLRKVPSAAVWAPYAVGFLWYMWPPDFVVTIMVFGAVHGLQYLACAHRAEVAWGIERGADNKVWWWSSAFGGALATGLLLVYWLPQLLTDAASATVLGTIPAALLFAFFNLHHYAVDASIWRFGGEHIRRITKGPRPVSSV